MILGMKNWNNRSPVNLYCSENKFNKAKRREKETSHKLCLPSVTEGSCNCFFVVVVHLAASLPNADKLFNLSVVKSLSFCNLEFQESTRSHAPN